MTKTVVITGASSGFGEACAYRYAGSDVRLVLMARRIQNLESIAESLNDKCELRIVEIDISNRDALSRFCFEYASVIEHTDILINSAGLALGLQPAYDIEIEDWENMVDTNIKGLMRLTREILPYMVKRNAGHIVNIGSVAGSWPYPGGNVYGATKAFVQQFSRGLRADLLGRNVRVSNIEPGMAKTEFSTVRFKGDSEKADKVYSNTKPLTARDIAEIVYWVTSLPSHVNINSLEVMPVCQAWGALAVDREML